jgi:7-cyano-7-deazaguanine synthase
MKKSALVVLSGGQDSTTCLLDAMKNYDEVHTIAFDYGQRHRRELECAARISQICGSASHEVVDAAGMLKSMSPLTNPAVQLETYTDHDSMAETIGYRIEKTFVPLRNPFFLLVAANHALAKDCYTLITGVCQGDNANYPDCTASFLLRMEEMIHEALGMNRADYAGRLLNIEAPLLFLSKADTVRLADTHGALGYAAIAASHTCYAGEYPPCGVCHSCVLRAEGFKQAGLPDPLIIESASHVR